MIFVGVDNGKQGAISAIDSSSNLLMLEDYPGDAYGCAAIIKKIVRKYESNGIRAAIERAQPMPKQGVKSMFTYGGNFHAWIMGFIMVDIPILLPTPQQWQKGVISKAMDKTPALTAARRLFPLAELEGPRGGAKDGRADSLLIADWCRRQFIGPQKPIIRRRKS